MTEAIAKGAKEHPYGYQAVSELHGAHSDMQMDFGILRMKKGDRYTDEKLLEKAYLLVYGKVTFVWEGKSHTECRENCFDVPPTVLHVSKAVGVTITCEGNDAEINIVRTDNETGFASRLFLPSDTKDEHRGAGLMNETSTRIVRTVFDKRNAPYSNMVLGEVIGFPGKWSSYPPHHHPQPEIYYYKTWPENGFGYAELGEDVVKVHQNDTLFISPGLTHPHCTAPGYALWYLWAIRHLDGNPYIAPTFLDEHLWVLEEKARFWPEKR